MIFLDAPLRRLLRPLMARRRNPVDRVVQARRPESQPTRVPAGRLSPLLACVHRLACWPAGLLACSLTAAEPTADVNALMRAGDAAVKQKNYSEAIQLAGKAMGADPKNARPLFLRAHAYNELQDFARAVADYDAGLKLNPKVTIAYQRRGEAHFRLGRFKESIADFDKFIELMPEQSPQHWQRGIALYYDGRYEDGRKQFEAHRTVNPYDVENAAWHFLCVARASGVEKARAALIPVERDSRVPMMQIHALFAGKAKPEDVLAAAKAGNPPPAQLDNQLFYAHLYLGLYSEALGDLKQAREHIFKAAADSKAEHYMGDVARVHAQVLRQREKFEK
jgi:lipoprotein NlpI